MVDSAHRPLAGVEVWRVDDEVVDQYSRWTFPPPVLLGVTGADGRLSTRGFGSTPGNVLVCKVGYLLQSLPSSGPGAPELVLASAARLSGRVLTPEGRPVRGAKVTARNPRWQPSDLLYETPPPRPCLPSETTGEARTDPEGRFVLPLAPDTYDLWATAAGYRRSLAGRRFALASGQAVAGIEIRLVPGAVVQGRVATPQGDPVVGARVQASQDDAEAVTDARGAYRLTGVSPGTQTLSVEDVAPGGDLAPRVGSQEIGVGPGENRLDFTLPRAGREVRGRVLTPNGNPQGGALLQVDCANRRMAVPSRADGSFVVRLPEGARRLMAFQVGYSPGVVDFPPGEAPVAGVVLRLTPEQRLTGRIEGRGAPGAEILLERVSGEGCSLRTFAQPDGTYRFAGVWPGAWTILPVPNPNLERRVEIQPGRDERVDLLLPP